MKIRLFRLFIVFASIYFFIAADLCLIFKLNERFLISYSKLSFAIFLQIGIFLLAIFYVYHIIKEESIRKYLAKAFPFLILLGFCQYVSLHLVAGAAMDGKKIPSRNSQVYEISPRVCECAQRAVLLR